MPRSKPVHPINTALFSFGMSGRVFHAPFLKASPFYNVTAVWERTKNLSRKMFPQARIYRDMEELLGDKTIELVIINTPNATHFEYAKKALQSGKHVVVEKPFTITLKEARALETLAKQHGLILSVYHNRRFDSDYRTLEKVLKSKKLGDIVEATFRFDRYRTHPGKKLHKEIPGPGSGNVYDLGSHLIDQALQLFGWPAEIFADIDILGAESKVENYFDIILFYPKCRVRLHSSYFVADTLPETVIYGSKGSFIKRKGDLQELKLSEDALPGGAAWGTDSKNGIMKTVRSGKIAETLIKPEKGNYGSYYDLLYEAVRNGRPVPVTPEQASQVIRIIEAAYKSVRLQKTIPIAPWR